MELYQKQTAISDDREHIASAQKDIRFFEPLYEKYFNILFRYVYQRMELKEDASDITATVFMKAMTGIGSYKITSAPFLGWLISIARNEVAGFYRKKNIEKRYYASLQGIEMLSEDAAFESSEGYFPIRKLLEMLPERDFELIDLKYFNAMSVREISLVTGLSENKIRVRLHRIRERLGRMVLARPSYFPLKAKVMAVFISLIF